MYPILGRYGPFFLYSYTVIMGLGIISGLGLTTWLARKIPTPRWQDGALVAMLAALLGGRIAFVGVNSSYFQQRPFEAWQIWQGGLGYHGALLAGLLGLWAWTRWVKRPFADYANLLAPALALLMAFGWAACWLEGCAYGRETFLGPLATNLPDTFGVFAVRYRTQLLGTLLALLIFVVIFWLRRRLKNDTLFWLTLALLSLSRLFLGVLRGDPTPQWNNVRLDVALDALLVISSLILLQYTRYQASVAAPATRSAARHEGQTRNGTE